MSNGGNNFTWNEATVTTLVWEAAKCVRAIRPFLTLYGKQGAPVSNIIGHRVTPGRPLTVDTSQPQNQLTPVTLYCDFAIHQDQFQDEDSLNTLAVEAAYRVAAAEEAVLMLGACAEDFLERFHVHADHLNLQTGLLPDNPPEVKGSILDSIVQGIKDLQANGRFGQYVAVVSLDLYQEAYRPRHNTFDAPIHEIRPLLVEACHYNQAAPPKAPAGTCWPEPVKCGFLYSQAVPPRTGVIFSQCGDGLKIAVPWDIHPELVDTPTYFSKQEGDQNLRIIEQIRLLVDVPEAVVPLRTSEISKVK